MVTFLAVAAGFDDDDERTIVTAQRDTLRDLIPDVPPVAPLEVVFDRETIAPGGIVPEGAFRALEIHTQNRIYVVDSTLVCVEVVDRATGARDTTKHSVIGAQLVGGQRRYDKTVHLARPFPVPGTEAVFQRPGKRTPAGVTSKVERVVLRIRVTSYLLETKGAWDDVTSALLLPAFGRPDPDE